MKKTDLYKNLGLKLENQRKQAGAAARFGGASGSVPDRKEQRKLDQAQGLVPFAVKINGDTVKQINALAQEQSRTVNDVVQELLQKGLAS